MLAPAATLLPAAGRQLTALTTPAETVGAQVAASAAAPPTAFEQVSVRPE